MNKLGTILLALALMSNTAYAAESSTTLSSQVTTKHVKWFTDYSEAAKVANSKSIPIVLFFTGSDWCTWCTKLEQEALDTPEFARLAADKFIFVKLDFPMRKPLTPQLTSQNDQLKKKFAITGFPSIIVVDANGSRIGATGYRPGGAKAYAEHLLAISSSFVKHQSTLQTLGAGDKNSFETLLEQYRSQIANGNLNSKEAILHRDRLLKSGSDTPQQTNREVAIVEFQALQQQVKQQKLLATETVHPLIQYVNAFETQDPEVWRIKMTISQAYLEGGKDQEALHYANEALQTAPQEVKDEINKIIEAIQTQSKA